MILGTGSPWHSAGNMQEQSPTLPNNVTEGTLIFIYDIRIEIGIKERILESSNMKGCNCGR